MQKLALGETETIQRYVEEVSTAMSRLSLDTIQQVGHLLKEARRSGLQVFLLGNGGSAATASHMACDLAKSTIRSGLPRLRVIALADNIPMLTAWANDIAYEEVFAQQLDNLVKPGDVVIAISGSGRSANILNAVRLARQRGAVTVGLTGFDGGDLKGLVDVAIVVESSIMGPIEDVHHIIGHILTACLAEEAMV